MKLLNCLEIGAYVFILLIVSAVEALIIWVFLIGLLNLMVMLSGGTD